MCDGSCFQFRADLAWSPLSPPPSALPCFPLLLGKEHLMTIIQTVQLRLNDWLAQGSTFPLVLCMQLGNLGKTLSGNCLPELFLSSTILSLEWVI